MNERCHAWNPISPALDGAEVTVEVIRVEATTRPAPPYGQSVLMLEIVARRAESGDWVGAWLLTFVYIMAYRMRPLNHAGNPGLTSPSEHAIFWKLFPSQYLVECTSVDTRRDKTQWHHYVIRTDLDGWCPKEDTYSATSHSMSPNELFLSFSAIDRAGHILLTVTLKKGEYYLAARLFDNRLSAAFEVDPTQLPGINAQLRDLFEEHGGMEDGN